jgi:hypothetical protein
VGSLTGQRSTVNFDWAESGPRWAGPWPNMGWSGLGWAQTRIGFTCSHVAYWILETGSGPRGLVHVEPGRAIHRTWSRSTMDRVHFPFLPLGPRCTWCTKQHRECPLLPYFSRQCYAGGELQRLAPGGSSERLLVGSTASHVL